MEGIDTILDVEVTDVPVEVDEMVFVPDDKDVLVADGKLKLVGTFEDDEDA